MADIPLLQLGITRLHDHRHLYLPPVTDDGFLVEVDDATIRRERAAARELRLRRGGSGAARPAFVTTAAPRSAPRH
jgi:hypothetical protein